MKCQFSQYSDKDNYMNYKVTQSEIDRIMEILDEFQDRMLSHGKVLYGGLVQAPRAEDVKVCGTSMTPRN